MYGRPPHVLLDTIEHTNGRIERKRGSWTFYQAHRNDGSMCNFATKWAAIVWLDNYAVS